MASRIITKKGSGAPLASDLVHGELAVDTVNKRLYTENAGGTIIELGTAPSTIDINAGTIDGTVIGGSSAAAGSFTTGQFGTSLNVDGTVTAEGLITDDDADDLITLGRFSSGYSYSLLRPSTDSTGIEVRTFGGNAIARFLNNGVAELYNNASKKLETTATGIDINGTVTADGLTVGTSNVQISGGTPLIDLQEVDQTDLNTRIKNGSAGFYIQTANDARTAFTNRLLIDHATGDVSLFENTGTTAKFFWDASAESLGIGTSSPSYLISANSAAPQIGCMVTGTSALRVAADGLTGYIYEPRNVPLTFATNSTERARLDASGNLLVGKTTTAFATEGAVINNNGSFEVTKDGGATLFLNRKTSDGAIALFYKDGTAVGSISVTGSTTAYNITSDERLKENIVDTTHTVDINDIKVRQYDWKSNGEHQRYGFIAQELEAVYPEAVFSPEDPEEMKAVDYSKLVPLLVKEIQDLKAEVAALKGV